MTIDEAIEHCKEVAGNGNCKCALAVHSTTEGGSMSEELKSCPFCGGKAQLHITNWGNVTWVECTRCFAMGERACEGDVKKQAIEAWNRREIDDYVIKLETDLEKAREQIEYLKDNRMAE